MSLYWKQNNKHQHITLHDTFMSLSPGQFTKQESDTVLDMHTFPNNWWIKIPWAHFSSSSFQHSFCICTDHLWLQLHVLRFLPSYMPSEDENFTFIQTGFVKCVVQRSFTSTATSHCNTSATNAQWVKYKIKTMIVTVPYLTESK